MIATTPTAATQPRRATSPGRDFSTGLWQKEINVRDFIQQNYDAVRRRRLVPRAGHARARRRSGRS